MSLTNECSWHEVSRTSAHGMSFRVVVQRPVNTGRRSRVVTWHQTSAIACRVAVYRVAVCRVAVAVYKPKTNEYS